MKKIVKNFSIQTPYSRRPSHVVVVANGDFNEHGSIWFTKPLTRVVTHDRAILLRLHRFFQRHGYGGRFNTHAQCTA